MSRMSWTLHAIWYEHCCDISAGVYEYRSLLERNGILTYNSCKESTYLCNFFWMSDSSMRILYPSCAHQRYEQAMLCAWKRVEAFASTKARIDFIPVSVHPRNRFQICGPFRVSYRQRTLLFQPQPQPNDHDAGFMVHNGQ